MHGLELIKKEQMRVLHSEKELKKQVIALRLHEKFSFGWSIKEIPTMSISRSNKREIRDFGDEVAN